MSPAIGDLSLFTKIVRDKLAGFTASYVEDTIHAGKKDLNGKEN